MNTADTIRPIITATYGTGDYAQALVNLLADRIDDWPNVKPHGGRGRKYMITNTIWDWMPGGSTAEAVAAKVENALDHPADVGRDQENYDDFI